MNVSNIPGPESSLQEVFDFIVAKLRAQGAKSLTATRHPKRVSICAYRGAEGRKCAAGHLIPDDQYDPLIENVRVYRLKYFENWPEQHLELVWYLQRVHDSKAVEVWELEWEATARFFKLIYTSPKETPSAPGV